MAAKRVVYLSILLALLINLGACSAYRAIPKGLSEKNLGGGGKWSSSKGDFGMTEVAGIDLEDNGHNGAGLGGQGAAGTGPGASIKGIGIGNGRKLPDQPNTPSGLDPDPPSPGMGMGGGSGIGIGYRLEPLPVIIDTGLHRQPSNYHSGDFGAITINFGTSTSTIDERYKNDIHNTATAMTPDPHHVHDQMMMGNMEGDKNAKKGQHNTVGAGGPGSDYDHTITRDHGLH